MHRPILWLIGVLLLVVGGISSASPGLADNGRLRQRLTAVWGQGEGRAYIEPFLDATTDFSARIRVTVDDAPPNTSFIVQRAPEVGRDAVKDQDGRCQRAFGFAPWSTAQPPAPSFVTFVAVNPDGTPTGAGNILLTTNSSGEGEVEFDFHAAAAAGLTSGRKFDVVFRLIDDLANPSTLLLGGCVTVTVT
jgi:hypothetical protein